VARTPAILLDQLQKDYGDVHAVQGLSVTVQPGEIFAFLGANGAGKTTTMKMMVGLLPPTSGRVAIAGHDVWKNPREAKRNIGYVPDTPILHELLTAREFLWFMSDLYDINPTQGRERATELLAMLDLSHAADKLIRDFSLGMKRKMAIATALLHRPPVLLLDEVTNGLDARAAREVKDLIASWAKAGAAVFLTTHILTVAEELADRIGLIKKGRLICVGTQKELAILAGKPEANLEEIFLTLTGDELDVVAEASQS
jgi:ABC-2 type transport system ATP-binding protein